MRAILLASAACLLTAGCGGGDSNASGGSVSVPAPAPAPAPAPTPTPTPTPGADPGGARLAGILVPGDLEGPTICTLGPITRANGRVADVGPGALSLVSTHIFVDVGFAYLIESFGFGGPSYGASSRLGGQAFEVFANGGTELQIIKVPNPLEFATYGLLTDFVTGGPEPNLCFFAVGARVAGARPATGQRSYRGFADGLSESAGDEDRLHGSTANLVFDSASSTYRLDLDLRAVENAFAEPRGQTQVPLGRVQGQLTLVNGRFEGGLTGPPGYIGVVTGTLGGRSFLAGLFTFELTHPDGSRIWGVIATDGA